MTDPKTTEPRVSVSLSSPATEVQDPTAARDRFLHMSLWLLVVFFGTVSHSLLNSVHAIIIFGALFALSNALATTDPRTDIFRSVDGRGHIVAPVRKSASDYRRLKRRAREVLLAFDAPAADGH